MYLCFHFVHVVEIVLVLLLLRSIKFVHDDILLAEVKLLLLFLVFQLGGYMLHQFFVLLSYF
jgi:hypothetical protein